MQFLNGLLLLGAVGCVCAQYEGYDFQGHLFEPNYPRAAPQREPAYPAYPAHHQEDNDIDYHAHPKYSFDYSVKDPNTGDDKEHWETRDGDKVKGSYTLVETDGTKRVVEYEADDKNGFNAVVHRIGTPVEVEHQHQHRPPVRHTSVVRRPVYEPPALYSQGFEDGFVPIAGYAH